MSCLVCRQPAVYACASCVQPLRLCSACCGDDPYSLKIASLHDPSHVWIKFQRNAVGEKLCMPLVHGCPFSDKPHSGTSNYKVYRVFDPDARHFAICDGCENTIVGCRFKCSVCDDFDYCSSCFGRNHHGEDSNHPFYILPYVSRRPLGTSLQVTMEMVGLGCAVPRDDEKKRRNDGYFPQMQFETKQIEISLNNPDLAFCDQMVDRLCEIEHECFKDLAWGRETLTSKLAEENYYTDVVQVSECNAPLAAAGYVMSRIEHIPRNHKYLLHGTCCHVLSLAVGEAFQGKGIGRRLLEQAIQRGKDLDVDYMRLHVWVENEKALNLYRTCGFREFLYVDHYYRKGDAFLMLLLFKTPPTISE